MPEWKKSSDAIKATFENSLPSDKKVERKQMFGMPCAFVNGNMFCGVFQETIMVRLNEDTRNYWIEKNKAKLFEPMRGRPMKEYIEVPASVLKDASKLKALIQESFDYSITLKPKEKNEPKVKKSSKLKK